MNAACVRLVTVCLLLGLTSGSVSVADAGATQSKPVKKKTSAKKPSPPDPERFWFDPRRAQAAAAAELVLAQNRYTVVGLRYASKQNLVWAEPEFASDEAPSLDPEWLADVRQRDRRAMPNMIGKAPDEIPKADRSFINLYNEALVHAFWTPPDAFAKSAKANAHLAFPHIYTKTDRYRGKVLHLEGRLRCVRKYDDVPIGARNKGVPELYEGWLTLPNLKGHPICLVFPVLPQELEPAEHMDRWAAFDGYLICLYRYTAFNEKELITPLFIGPTVQLGAAPPAAEKPLVSPKLLYGFVIFVGIVVLVVVGLNWWFRRGDQRVRKHLAEIQAQRAVEMLEDDRQEGM